MPQITPNRFRRITLERLEHRQLLSGVDVGEHEIWSAWHNGRNPHDVNASDSIEPLDALIVINAINRGTTEIAAAEGESEDAWFFVDVNNDSRVSAIDALLVINRLEGEAEPPPPATCDTLDTSPILTADEVDCLLRRASVASASEDAIIAIVDRGGRILGVRVEQDVIDTLDDPGNTTTAGNGNGKIDAGTLEEETLVFAIDGAVAKARTAALFSSGAAPLPSRTVRFISQSTITQREVQSNPNIPDMSSTERGPGFVAPIGVGGHFPPEVAHTPQVDLFAIEHQSRDSEVHAGADNLKGTADDLLLSHRFNVNGDFIPSGKELVFPESYGRVSERLPLATSRGIATLPGGMPLYKDIDAAGMFGHGFVDVLVGGIGVFFPGEDGFATHEQGFVAGVGQSEKERTNSPKVLESEWIAYAAAGGSAEPPCFAPVGDLDGVPPVPGYTLPCGRIDLVGITLEIYGPHPTRENRLTGPQRLLQVGSHVGVGDVSGKNEVVAVETFFLDGQPVPSGWLVEPHDSAADPSLTKEVVKDVIDAGIASAEEVRAAIRLTPADSPDDLPRRPGERTRMVFAVADTTGEVLGLFRMPDATVFSIDVAVAKARNTAYYADATEIETADLVDDNDDGLADVPAGTAFTNRTFRFLAEPRFPTGAENVAAGDFSILRDAGINPLTAENLGSALAASVYSSADASVLAFDAFNPARNFRDPLNLENQNGIVFFPGSTPLYVGAGLVGGFGVSGDGVDQDDVVTAAGQVGYEPAPAIRADLYRVRSVSLPFQKYLRNPLG